MSEETKDQGQDSALRMQEMFDRLERAEQELLKFQAKGISDVGAQSAEMGGSIPEWVPGPQVSADPFQLSAGSGLNVVVTNGTLYGSGITSGVTLGGTEALTASSTNYVYVKAWLLAAPSAATVKYYWEIDNTTNVPDIVVTTSPQSISGELPTDSSGIAYLLLGTVTTDGSGVTAINQTWTGNVELVSGIGFFLWGRR